MEVLNKIIRNSCNLFFGSKFRAHKIPFGPLSGKYIYLKPSISPRMFFGINEPGLVNGLQQLIKKNDIIYDIGAHIGYITILCADLVTDSGQIHCFELMPATAEKLQKTIGLNGLKNCSIHTIGLSNQQGKSTIELGDTYMGSLDSLASKKSDKQIQTCCITTLDSYVQEQAMVQPTLIKMDIEGGEVQALEGAKELLNNSIPLLTIEFHSLALLHAGRNLLSDLGYSILLFSGLPITDEYIKNITSFHQNVLCIHNNTSWHRDRLKNFP